MPEGATTSFIMSDARKFHIKQKQRLDDIGVPHTVVYGDCTSASCSQRAWKTTVQVSMKYLYSGILECVFMQC